MKNEDKHTFFLVEINLRKIKQVIKSKDNMGFIIK